MAFPIIRYWVHFFLVILFLVNWWPEYLGAQSVGGTIRGRVRDSSGGLVAEADLRVQDMEKGIIYPSQTDSQGMYQVALPPGRYEVQAEAPGFAPMRETGITLSLGQTLSDTSAKAD